MEGYDNFGYYLVAFMHGILFTVVWISVKEHFKRSKRP